MEHANPMHGTRPPPLSIDWSTPLNVNKYPLEWHNDTTGIDREEAYVKTYVNLTADAKVFFAPGGVPLASASAEIANKGIHSGTYSIFCEFLANLKITDKSKCLAVQLRPYTINMLGERTNHSTSKWYDIYYPHNDANYIGSGEAVLVNIN